MNFNRLIEIIKNETILVLDAEYFKCSSPDGTKLDIYDIGGIISINTIIIDSFNKQFNPICSVPTYKWECSDSINPNLRYNKIFKNSIKSVHKVLELYDIKYIVSYGKNTKKALEDSYLGLNGILLKLPYIDLEEILKSEGIDTTLQDLHNTLIESNVPQRHTAFEDSLMIFEVLSKIKVKGIEALSKFRSLNEPKNQNELEVDNELKNEGITCVNNKNDYILLLEKELESLNREYNEYLKIKELQQNILKRRKELDSISKETYLMECNLNILK